MAETGSRGVDVEGGGRGDENPFSFKSFVKRASTGGPGAEGEQGKGGKRERGRGRKARPATTLSSEGDVPFPEEGKDNPFSFKQFVRKQTLSQVSDGSSSSDGEHSLSNSLERAPGPLAPDSPTLPLPATVTTAAPPPRDKNNKPPKKPKSTSRNSQPLPSTSNTIIPSASGTITGGKDSKKSVSSKEKNRRKDKLFSDSESDSDIFTNTGPDLPLPFPADVSPTGVSVSGGDPLGAFGGGGKEVGDGEKRTGVLLLSDSSEDSVVMMGGSGKVFPGVQSVELVSEELRTLNSQMLRDRSTMVDWFTGLYAKNKWKSFKVVLGPFWYTLICVHPDTVKVVLKSDPKSGLYNIFKPWLGEGLLIASGAQWARSRKLLTPAFHFDVLKPYVQVFTDTANTLVGEWSKVPEGKSFNVFPHISLLTLDVMLRCTCSYQSNCQTNKTHDPYIKAVFDLSILGIKRSLFLPATYDLVYACTPDGWRNRRACNIVHSFSRNIIQERRKALETMKQKGGEDIMKGSKRKYLDFIDILLEARDEDGHGLTDKEIRNEVDTFLFEGHDTTAAGLAWTLYNLARYPEHQEKCRQEVDAIFNEKDVIDWDDLKNRLTYVKYCIKESLRLYPPVYSHGRQLAQDTEIDGRVFPAGTMVNILPYCVHRCADIWENPEEFDPLRFTPENSKDRHPHAFIAFAAGPRNCIGQEFAISEMKTILSCILRQFELTLDPDRPPQKNLQVIMRPKNGLYLNLKHRNV